MRVNKPKGLGDTIHNLTVTTGIKRVVNAVSDALEVDCGCDNRRKPLNNLFPYKK